MARKITPEIQAAVSRAANRLHHLSMRYVGGLMEVAKGSPVGFIPAGYPGMKEMRDLIDLILYCRAEQNALTKCLCDAGLLQPGDIAEQVAKEYEWLAQAKAKFLGVEVDDHGITIKGAKGGG